MLDFCWFLRLKVRLCKDVRVVGLIGMRDRSLNRRVYLQPTLRFPCPGKLMGFALVLPAVRKI